MQGRENYIFSFLGMAPKDNPKLLMYVVVERPKLELDQNGALPVSEIFKPVMKSSLQYLNIEPEKKEEAVITKLPDLTDKSPQKASELLKEKGLVPVLIGSGEKVLSQSPKHGDTVIEGEKVIIKTDGKLSIPDMAGWSKRDVLKVAKLAELKVNMVGTGYLTKQNIKPKSRVSAGDHLVVNFEPQAEILDKKKSKNDKSNVEAPLD